MAFKHTCREFLGDFEAIHGFSIMIRGWMGLDQSGSQEVLRKEGLPQMGHTMVHEIIT